MDKMSRLSILCSNNTRALSNTKGPNLFVGALAAEEDDEDEDEEEEDEVV